MLGLLINTWKSHKNLLCVLAIFIFSEILINPIGDFPLNDDWAYGKTIQTFMLEGVVSSSEWGEAFFLTQMVWGLLFCKIFGFSFTVLRFSQIIMGIVGVIIFYNILIRLSKSTSLVSHATCMLLFNPVVFQQLNTFQTDIPFAVFSLISFYCLFRYVQDSRWYNYIVGVLFALFAILIKQTGIAIAITYCLCYVLFSPKRYVDYFTSFITTCLLIMVVPVYQHLSELSGGFPASNGFMSSVLFNTIASPDFHDLMRIGYYIINTSLSFGLFVAPFTLVCFMEYRKKAPYLFNNLMPLSIICILGLLIIAVKTYYSGNYLPFSGNIIYDIGLGPIIMTGIDQNILLNVPKLGIIMWLIISFIGFLGFMSMIYLILSLSGMIYSNSYPEYRMLRFTAIYSIVFSIIYITPFLVVNANIRYTNVILPYIILFVVVAIEFFRKNNIFLRKANYRNIKLLLAPIIIFGIVGTHDYLSFQRGRWKALNHLTRNESIPIDMIDGGFEFNEWHYSEKYDVWDMTDDIKKKGRFWPVVDDKYIVTVIDIDGYDLHKEFKYRRWLPFGDYSINVLKKSTE